MVLYRAVSKYTCKMEGGRDVSGERHDEGKGRVSTQGGAGREGQNSITCVEKS